MHVDAPNKKLTRFFFGLECTFTRTHWIQPSEYNLGKTVHANRVATARAADAIFPKTTGTRRTRFTREQSAAEHEKIFTEKVKLTGARCAGPGAGRPCTTRLRRNHALPAPAGAAARTRAARMRPQTAPNQTSESSKCCMNFLKKR